MTATPTSTETDRLSPRYPTLAILLHWCTAVLVVVDYILSEDSEHFGNKPPALHFTLGFSVLVFTVARWAARYAAATPPAQSTVRWMPARVVHATLYLLLLAVPLSGWYSLSRMGLPMFVLGSRVPAIATTAPDHAPGMVGLVHQLAGNVLLIVAALHAGAAVWHQFVIKDNLLRRMRPF
jgi:superoxide oxidase